MQVPVRELKAALSSYLARARAGEIVEVTSHRRAIARIVGVPATENAGLAILMASGEVSWNGHKLRFAKPLTLNAKGKSVSRMVLEDRG
jgi:prevent-host-death family protein